MRIFVTGATGFIGSAIVPELLDAGHEVVGLARSDAGRRSAGARRRRGPPRRPRGPREPARRRRRGRRRDPHRVRPRLLPARERRADRPARDRGDRRGARGLGAAAGHHLRHRAARARPGGDRGRTGPTRSRAPRTGPRRRSTALALAERGVRSSVVRFPPTVHGEGDHGFVPVLIGVAREQGVSALRRRRRQPLAGRAPAATPRALFRLARGERAGGLGVARRRRGGRARPATSPRSSAATSTFPWPRSLPRRRPSTSAGSAASSRPTSRPRAR